MKCKVKKKDVGIYDKKSRLFKTGKFKIIKLFKRMRKILMQFIKNINHVKFLLCILQYVFNYCNKFSEILHETVLCFLKESKFIASLLATSHVTLDKH